jgi:hypothetical protein
VLLGPIRTLISLLFLAGLVWFSFAVPLGSRTLAQHMDRIGQTPEARELVDGTRDTVNPVLQDAADRVLGERVEAPTYLAPADVDVDAEPPVSAPAEPEEITPVRTIGPDRTSGPDAVKLPGRR